MSVHPSPRPSAAKAETGPTAAGDAIQAGDLFTVIVTGLSDGHTGGPDVPEGGPLPPQTGKLKAEPQAGTSDPNEDAAASVEQLLALVAGGRTAPSPRQGKTKDQATTREKPQAKADTEIAASDKATPAVATIVPA